MFHQPGEPTEGYGEFAPPLRDQFTLQQLVKHRTVPDTEKNLHRRKLISAWLSGLEIGDDDPKKK